MTASKKAFRIERDVMGTVSVPAEAYYGNQTVRAAHNFRISNLKIHPALTKALIEIKKAAAEANYACKVLDSQSKTAIIKACNELLTRPKDYEDQFILDVFQAGAGTPWHMNVNEVITNLALELMKKRKGDYKILDPHDHVNKSQSTNDVMMSALRIATITQLAYTLKALTECEHTLQKKAKAFATLKKAGRTHLQDAVPITLGQEFDAWAHTLKKRIAVLNNAQTQLYTLHLGGTAVGTGINAPKGFDKNIIQALKHNTKLPVKIAPNKIEQTQFMSDFLDVSAALRTIATDLIKIGNDIRLLASGPRTGLSEITLPKVEPGSSIMPAKFNPSIGEMLTMVCFQVMGNDHTILQASEAGQLELNVFGPIIAHNLLQSLDILTSGVSTFTSLSLEGIQANKETLRRYYEQSPSIGAVLNPIVGYEHAAKIIEEALASGKTVKQLVIDKGILSKRVADKLLGAE